MPSSADSTDHTNLDSQVDESTGFTHIFRISVPEPSTSSGQTRIAAPVTATSRGDVSEETGGDPRTVHSLSDGGVAMARSLQEEGGDPKTDLSLFVGKAGVDSPLRGGWQPKLTYFPSLCLH